jgi:hypothetical protein
MLKTLSALIHAYKNCDLTDDEVVSLWNCYVIYLDESANADYQFYDSLDPFSKEECTTLTTKAEWYVRDPWHTDALLSFDNPYGAIKDLAPAIFHGYTFFKVLDDLYDDLRQGRIDPDEATDFINSYRMEQYDPCDDDDDEDY